MDNVSLINNQFIDKVASDSERSNVEYEVSQYVKSEILESAFSRAILPQQPISVEDCQNNLHDNSLYLLRDIEPSAAAVGVDIYGEPTGQYIQGGRVLIPIVDFSTLRYQIRIRDLRAYKYKITKRIEDKSAPALEELEDKWFLKLSAAAVSTSPLAKQKGSGGPITSNTEGAALKIPVITLGDMLMAKNQLIGGLNGGDDKKLELGCVLMTTETFNTSIFMPSEGDDYGKDRVENGIVSDTLNGTRIIKSIKSNLLPNGHLWSYTKPDFLGFNFALGDPKFEIKSNFGLIEFQTEESVGMGIARSQAVGLRTLAYSVIPGGTIAGTWSTAPPYNEETILYVDEDGVFPLTDPGSGVQGHNTFNLLKYYESLEI